MLPFLIVGGVGLVLLLVSLLFDDILDFLDGALSGTAIGSALVIFGASGVIAVANGMPAWAAYLIATVIAIVAFVAVQLLIRALKRSEDGAPSSPVGLYGVSRSNITTTSGEVSLDGPNEIETRLAFADEPIPRDTRIHVIELQGARVRVERAVPLADPAVDAATD
ncbi:NfeD family protein [Protaetiibacter mangrovi]|uniref:NfeD family protein n=1 Tax=Protaetiibacter mangrovi TaxID=2970926 RepID=A0ABT1ZCN7_9MICO|nr:NfeD family protein [Protaetiibacter mangrovi]MCS0498457.1 NfeD family protein [Protaetiibacter mangrovi]